MTSAGAGREWNADEVSLGKLAGVLRRRKWTVIRTMFLSFTIAAGLTLWLSPRYTAEARLLVEEPTGMSSMMGQLAKLPRAVERDLRSGFGTHVHSSVP